MPKTEDQFKEAREIRKSEIKDTALDLFARFGYHSTSISQIAKEANMSKGLLYNYYDGKQDLLKDIIMTGFKKLTQLNNNNYETDEDIVQFIEKTIEEVKASPAYWKLYFSLLLQPSVYESIIKDFTELFNNFFSKIVGYFQKKGVKNPVAEVLLLTASLDGVCMNYVSDTDFFPIDDIKEIYIERFKQTFCK